MSIKLSNVNKVLKLKIYFPMSEVVLSADQLKNKFIIITQTVQYWAIYIFLFKLVLPVQHKPCLEEMSMKLTLN